MELSSRTSERLSQAELVQADYSPNNAINEQLADKSLISVVAPAGEGKSFVMENTATRYESFSLVTGWTSREEETRDTPGRYTYFPHTDDGVNHLLDMADRGDLVQYVVHPTTKRLYGSFIEDYHTPYNLLDTQSGAVAALRRIAFRKHHVIGLVSEPRDWIARFVERYPENTEERRKRLGEAIISLRWETAQPRHEITWIKNHKDNPDQTSIDIFRVATVHTHTPDLSDLAYGSLAAAKGLL